MTHSIRIILDMLNKIMKSIHVIQNKIQILRTVHQIHQMTQIEISDLYVFATGCICT